MFTRHTDQLERALALDGGGYTLGDVQVLIQQEMVQLWEAPDAVLITEVHDLPRFRSIHFWLAAGELESVIELSHQALKWARLIGCTRATLAGRKGWERVLADEGWTFGMTVLSKELV